MIIGNNNSGALEDNTSRAFCLSELYNNDYNERGGRR